MIGSDRKYALPPILLLIVVAAIAAHFRSLNGPFQFDDERDIVYRSAVSNGISAAAISSPFRAITYAAYAIDWKIGGGSPRVFHAVNLLLHCLSSVLLFLTIRRFLNSRDEISNFAALAGALAFAMHPACSASVDYISGRAGLISAAAGISMVFIWLGGDFRGRIPALIALQIVALFGKEDAVVYPALIALLWLAERKNKFIEIVPLFVICAIYGAARLFAHPVIVAEPGREVSLASHLSMQPYAVFRAFAAWFYPVGMSVDHHLSRISGAADMRLWLCLIFIISVAAIALWNYRNDRKCSAAAFGWFVIALAPGAMVPLADPVSENRWYFALAGLSIWSACIVKRAISENPRLAKALVSIWLAALCISANYRSMLWSDPAPLWAEATRLYPNAARPWSNYAQSQFRAGKYLQAERAARTALSIEIDDPITWNTLGLTLKDMGRHDEAGDAYSKAIFYDPKLFVAYTNRANIFAAAGKSAEAEADYRAALRIKPLDPDANYGMGWVMHATGRDAQAVLYLRKVLEISPNDVQAKNLLAEITK